MAAIGKKTGDTKAPGAFYGRVAWFINTRRSTEGAYPCKRGRSTGAAWIRAIIAAAPPRARIHAAAPPGLKVPQANRRTYYLATSCRLVKKGFTAQQLQL